MNTGKIWIGLGGLAVGLAGGCFIPRGGEHISAPASSPSRTAAVTKSARSAAERAEARKSGVAKKRLQPVAVPDGYTERTRWLENLPTGDLSALIQSLCADIGPNGLEDQDKGFLQTALKKWVLEDRDGALAWVANLPDGATKRFMMKGILSELLEGDSARALALSEAFQAQDPKWNHVKFHDTHVRLLVDKAWEKPGASADEMFDLFSKLSRGEECSGRGVGHYPENFDFRKFLDSIVALKAKDRKDPSGMPNDILEGWAKVDPQAAAQWFLDSTEKQIGVPFQKWDNIANAVSTKLGPQPYHEWAADIMAQSTEQQRKVILESVSDQDALGIVSHIEDTSLRDQILATMARQNSGTSGKFDQTLEFLGKISSPEARLQTLQDHQEQFKWWSTHYSIEASAWQKIGLTQEQVSAALAEKH